MPTLTELNSEYSVVSSGLAQSGPQNAALSDGRQVVTWQTRTGLLYFKIVDSEGKSTGSSTLVSTIVGPNSPSDVKTLSDGSFIVVYTEQISSNNSEIRATRYSDTGQKIGTEMNLMTDAREILFAPTVTSLSDGGFAVLSGGYSSSDSDHSTFVRAFDIDGTPRGPMAQLDLTTAGKQVFPEAVGVENGGLVAVWTSGTGDGSGTSVKMRLVDGNGVPQGREIQVNQYTPSDQQEPAIARLDDGSVIVVWHSKGQDGSEGSIIARHFSAQGVPQGNEFIVNVTRAGEQTLPTVVALNEGGFVVAWTNLTSRPDTMARQYDYNLRPVTGEIKLSQGSLSRDIGPELSALSNGGVGFVWMDISVVASLPTLGVEVRTTHPSDFNPTEGNDLLSGDAGNNRIFARDGDDWVSPGIGSDTVDGGAGNDMVSFIDHRQAVRVDLSEGRVTSGRDINHLSNVENVTGSSFADYIVGDDGDNRLRGAGSYDWFIGSDGADFYDGGSGRDMVSYVSSSGAVQVDLTRGRGQGGMAEGDRYQSIERVTGSSFEDHLTGDAGDNDLRGLGSYDWFVGTAGRDRYDGGSGLDMISYASSSAAVSVDLSQGRGTRGDAAKDSYVSVERVTGSSHDDVLIGDDGRNVLRGLYGEDTLLGNAGVDRLHGGASDDFLDGGAGWDFAIFDGNRDDYNVTRQGERTLVERVSPGNEGIDTLVNIEVIQFQDDFLYL
ncbi:type I secretion target repeat protein [Ruegeria pomeroyi DSS-3]|uniref:Type I secretion target repeat protein n=2 Tax=Ruegeria pomeroyi TaxID=89184 RepID=Q5LXE6_RUEPO|nr:type I secretion target repeat protein [Ruegeria pomeroyi DSS-3]